MKKTLVCFALIALCVFAQVEDDEIITETKEVPVTEHNEEFEQGDAPQGEEAGENPYDNEEFREQIRDLYVSCIVTSRQKINTYGDQLVQALTHYSDKAGQTEFYRKVLAEHINACIIYGSQNLSVPKKIIQSLQTNTFDIKDWEVIFLNVDFSKFVAPDYSLALSQEETQILQVVDQFDEVVKKETGKGGDSNEGDDDEIPNIFGKKQTYEPHIGGFSLNSVSKNVQVFYFVLIIAALGAAIYYGYNKIDDNSSEPKIKEKKNKAKKTQ